jgi:hypothetical protein
MPVLAKFSTPANLSELSAANQDAWSDKVEGIIAPFAAAFPQFYDPTAEDTPAGAEQSEIAWSAFPARVLRDATSNVGRWTQADGERGEQDEYCEWSVERDDHRKITRVTFTCEVREYWELVAERDPNLLVSLYREFVDSNASKDELFAAGSYDPANSLNVSTTGRLAHLVQPNNNLGAAVDLAAKATVLRVDDDGQRVASKQALVACADLGDPFRNSDPQIAAGVNDAAARGAEVTLADPAGLYIDGLIAAGIETPNGDDPLDFWQIERGDRDHILRASFAVPADRGYKVGDVKIGGRLIEFGAQLADKVTVSLTALAKPGTHHPTPKRCHT